MLCAKNRRQTDAVRMFSMFKASNYRGRGRRQGSVVSGRGASGKQVRRPAVRERNGQVRHCECKKDRGRLTAKPWAKRTQQDSLSEATSMTVSA